MGPLNQSDELESKATNGSYQLSYMHVTDATRLFIITFLLFNRLLQVTSTETAQTIRDGEGSLGCPPRLSHRS